MGRIFSSDVPTMPQSWCHAQAEPATQKVVSISNGSVNAFGHKTSTTETQGRSGYVRRAEENIFDLLGAGGET